MRQLLSDCIDIVAACFAGHGEGRLLCVELSGSPLVGDVPQISEYGHKLHESASRVERTDSSLSGGNGYGSSSIQLAGALDPLG